ncbi:uncharacterized protein LOC111711021 [Eurytemora carolleeae]|uniref:uncharacterized protein LOC111711021 n=1 Tax=Eurytemora carolleeae TaxID=1294199 RepID=UPI000C76E357|nr:uncharacterized protein LOC111711021 [Eurytemora carolleeae]|eukprot:XP_023341014.1 uncharacterized protein LOC111711021 [Eurytemora affinis]
MDFLLKLAWIFMAIALKAAATSFYEDTALLLAKSLLNPDNIAQTLSLQGVKRSPNFEEFNNEYLGINVKLEHLNTNTSTGHIADITVNDLAKLHLPCINGKVLKLNVEFNQDENHLNIKVKYLFPEGNNLTGGFKLEHSQIMDSSRTNLKYLDSFFEVDVQLSGKMFKGSIIDMFNQMYYFSGNIEPGVVFSLSMENSISVNLLDISLNFQSLETKFKVDQSVYTLVLPYSSYLSSLSPLELKLEDHDDSIEASISYGTCICKLEYLKNSTSIMRISVYESMNILLDLRLKAILKEDNFENKYHEIGFSNGTMRLGAWEGPNIVYRCLACDEYIWKLVEIGGDTLSHQDEEIYDKDNMDSGSGDFGSGYYG